MKQNLQFPDGKLAVKSINEIYADNNGNVTVDHVATADSIGDITATQVADAVSKAHTHDNKTTLDKLADASGKLTYNGSEIGGTVDETRLLPVDNNNGDIPCYSKDTPVGLNYNDGNTVLLLQGSTTNTANGTILSCTTNGSPTLQDDGSLLFAASDQIKTTSAAEVKRVFGNEFTVDLYVKPTQFNNTTRQDTNFFNLSGPSTYRVYLSNFEDGGNTIKDKWGLWAYAGEREITLNNDEWHHVAVDVYLVSGTRKYTFYYDGVPVLTDNWYNDGLASAAESVSAVITFFGASDNQNFTNGYVKSLRVSDVARYKGVQFNPPTDGEYINPPDGYWSTLNESTLVKTDSKRLLPENPVNGDIPCFDATATVGGEWNTINKTSLVNSINGITPDDIGNVTLDLLTEEQKNKLDSIVLANDFTFTQSDIVSNMITKSATTLGVPAGSMVQVLSNTGIVMTERAGILVYWSGNNLIIDFTGYFNTTQATLNGTWTVKFAGNFVGSGSGGGTVSAIAYPIVLVKPTYADAIHLEMVYATQDDYSDAQTLVNTKTTSADRSLVKAFGGAAWEACPEGGFGSVYDKQPVKIIVSSKLDATTIYNIKYRWVSAYSDTSVSDWYGMVYPCYTEPAI